MSSFSTDPWVSSSQHSEDPDCAAHRAEILALLDRDDEAGGPLSFILESNTWSTEVFAAHHKEFQSLELFMMCLTTVPFLSLFPSLKVLFLVQIGLKELSSTDLAPLTGLEVLWICENHLTTITDRSASRSEDEEGRRQSVKQERRGSGSGRGRGSSGGAEVGGRGGWSPRGSISASGGGGALSVCPRLREVYAYSNKLSSFSPFCGLLNLEVLDVSRNRLLSLAGASTLPCLRILNAADNNISALRGAFDKCPGLEELNVSGNQLISFRELRVLRTAGALRRLYLTDPLYGTNSVTASPGYQVATLAALPNLELLDGMRCTAAQRELAIRIKDQRFLFYRAKLHGIAVGVQRLILLSSRVAAQSGNLTPPPPISVHPPLTGTGTSLPPVHVAAANCARAVVSGAIETCHRLILEALSAGGFSAEEGCSTDGWLGECEHLIESYFSAEDMQHEFPALGSVYHARILRATRLSSAARTSCFNTSIRQLTGTGDAEALRPSIDRFLFSLPLVPPRRGEPAADLTVVASDLGLRALCAANGFPPSSIPLTNSVMLADQARLSLFADKDSVVDTSRMRHTRFFVVRAFTGNSASERAAAPCSPTRANTRFTIMGRPSTRRSVFCSERPSLARGRVTPALCAVESNSFGDGTDWSVGEFSSPLQRIFSISSSSGSEALSLVTRGAEVDRRDYARDVLSVTRPFPKNHQQRIWFFFDEQLILLEYILDVAYDSSESVGSGASDLSRLPQSGAATAADPEMRWPPLEATKLDSEVIRVFGEIIKETVPLEDLRPVLPFVLAFMNNYGSSCDCCLPPTFLSSPPPATHTTPDCSLPATVLRDDRHASATSKVLDTDLVEGAVAQDDVKKKEKAYLCLSFKSIISCSLMRVFEFITKIDLSNNALLLDNAGEWGHLIRAFPLVTTVDLSKNRIKGIFTSDNREEEKERDSSKLCLWDHLVFLNLQDNCIRTPESLLGLASLAPHLVELRIIDNPLLRGGGSSTAVGSCGLFVALYCCNLTCIERLDGVPLCVIPEYANWKAAAASANTSWNGERAAASVEETLARTAETMFVALTGTYPWVIHALGDSHSREQQLRDSMSQWSSVDTLQLWPVGLDLLAAPAPAPSSGEGPIRQPDLLFFSQFHDTFTHIVLNGCTVLPNILPQLLTPCSPSLVHLQLTHLGLLTFPPAPLLRPLHALEVLDLRHNCLSALPPELLTLLPSLRRLDVSYNFIADVEPLLHTGSPPPPLECFSAEENQIKSMLFLGVLSNVKEVYLGANSLDVLTEINTLRDALGNLEVLRLAGNALCINSDKYRLYTIFHIKSLRWLDFDVVTSAEAVAARDEFAGRISAELLREAMAPETRLEAVKQLDLSYCLLNDVRLLAELISLEHLTLAHNNLTCVEGLEGCRRLRSLDLSDNRLREGPSAEGGAGGEGERQGGGVEGDNGGDDGKSERPCLGVTLKPLRFLQALSLARNGIEDLHQLALVIPSLRFLDLTGNRLSELDALQGVPGLRELILSDNRLRSLSRPALLSIAALRVFICDRNALKTLGEIQVLRYLREASFEQNRLSDIQEIFCAFQGMPLQQLSLRANPVIHKPTYRSGLIYAMFNTIRVLDEFEVSDEERARVAQRYSAYGEVFAPAASEAPDITKNIITDTRREQELLPAITKVFEEVPESDARKLRLSNAAGQQHVQTNTPPLPRIERTTLHAKRGDEPAGKNKEISLVVVGRSTTAANSSLAAKKQ